VQVYQDFDLESFSVMRFQADLLEKGALLFRGSQQKLEDFLRFSARMSDRFLALSSEQGMGAIGANFNRTPVADFDNLFHVTGKRQGFALPLHGEGYFHFKQPPTLLWFYCAQPAEEKGQTFLCDGGLLYESLPFEIQAGLLAQDLVYTRQHTSEVWQKLYRTEELAEVAKFCNQRGIDLCEVEGGDVLTRFQSPALQKRAGRYFFVNNLLPFALRQLQTPDLTRARVALTNGEALPENWVLTIQAQARQLQLKIDWQKGDFLAVDNTRFLHGRDPIDDPQRELYLRLGYADFISMANG